MEARSASKAQEAVLKSPDWRRGMGQPRARDRMAGAGRGGRGGSWGVSAPEEVTSTSFSKARGNRSVGFGTAAIRRRRRSTNRMQWASVSTW